MSDIIKISIDVTKLDRSAIIEGKNGGKWLNLVAFSSKESKYGETHYVKQDFGKDRKEDGKAAPIIGNVKPIGGAKPQAPKAKADNYEAPSDDVPF